MPPVPINQSSASSSSSSSSAPLADWFFITGLPLQGEHQRPHIDEFAGVDSEQLTWGSNPVESTDDIPQPPVEQTIEEERTSEAENGNHEISIHTPHRNKRNSYQRLSRLSDEARLSIASITLSPDHKGTDSNRSSTTIKAFQVNGTNHNSLSDFDFDKALRKFATERESFLTDLTLTAGAVVPNRPKARLKTQRITNEENGGLKSGVGTVRRRISFRDMNSVKRQSSVNRQCRSISDFCNRTRSHQVPPHMEPPADVWLQ